MSQPLTVYPLTDFPEVQAHHDLGVLLRQSLLRARLDLRTGDVLVVSSKVVSKSEGLRVLDEPTTDAGGAGHDAIVLSQARRVVAERRTAAGLTRIVAATAGPVLAAAGVDASNTGPLGGTLLLPPDPDLAARMLYASLLRAYAPAALPHIGIIVSDTAGRAWREGQTDFALGTCGVGVLDDLRGGQDRDGRGLQVTARAVADEIAAAADLVKGKAAHIPAALVRGLQPGTVTSPGSAGAVSLLRSSGSDWFALGHVEAIRSALGAPPGGAVAAQIGIAANAAEPEGARLQRAITLSLHGAVPAIDRNSIAITASTLSISVDDDYQRGWAVARLEVALHSEGLTGYRVSAEPDPSADASAETSGVRGAVD